MITWTETPRYDLERKIRQHIQTDRRVSLMRGPSTREFSRLYDALSERDRAIVYRVAISLAEHAGHGGSNDD